MAKSIDPRIAEVLSRYGEDPNDTKTVLWDCHGTWVVYHAAVERIAVRAGVRFFPPEILRAEKDEAVILVTAELGDRTDWDIGECLVGVNYKVSPRQAAYVWAMASKRARDRVVLKLVGLHGLLYSEEEADSFKPAQRGLAPDNDLSADEAVPICVNGQPVSSYRARKDGNWTPLVEKLRACTTRADLLLWSGANKETIEGLPGHWRNELRDEYAEKKASIEAMEA